MCLVISQPFNSRKEAEDFIKNPPILEKDLVVYKLLRRRSNISPHRCLKYEKGFHYYNTGKNAFKFYIIDQTAVLYRVHITVGLHANLKKLSIDSYWDVYHQCKMIIPKGSIYFLGRDNDIVTNNLIWY